MEPKIKKLIDLCQGIYEKKDGNALYQKYKKDIQSVTPADVFLVMNELLKTGLSVDDALLFVDKIINVFNEPLNRFEWNRPKDGFIHYLMAENNALAERLDAFKAVIKTKDENIIQADAPVFLRELEAYNHHMLKLENILFPYMEKVTERYAGLKIMWALHDRARLALKDAIILFERETLNMDDASSMLGRLYFLYYGLIKKQQLILFPAASKVLDEKIQAAMHLQSYDFEFSYIDRPKKQFVDINQAITSVDETKIFKTETGSLTLKQLEVMMNTLPVDVTFVSADDTVAYYSAPKERIFPRTPVVIGRNVRNCHPPQSVHVVEKILEGFKQGKRDKETFWIQMGGKFILIQYFAVRDEGGEYLGTLEVSQEVSGIKSLEGEKRLLD